MKIIHSKNASKRIIKNISQVIFSFALFLTLVLTIPGENHIAYAALLEDCDLDGFDDATGVAVPWPGYDETKGDTPQGPGGSNTTATASGSTADSNIDSETIETTDNAPADTNNSTTDDTTKSSANNTAGSTTKSATSENTNSTTSEDTNSTSISDDKTSTSSAKSDSTVNETSAGAATGTISSTSTEKSGTTTTDITSSTTEEADGSTSGDVVSDESSVIGSEGASTQGDSEVVAESSNPGVIEDTNFSEVNIDSIINTKGTLDILETTGSLIHAGGDIIITGSGFQGNIDNLEIVIYSEPQQLGVVTSGADGSFEIQVNLPENLEPGTHHIVVLYQGKEIISQQIEVGAKAADGFFQALSVGFSGDNEGLVPGLAILGGLFIFGLAVLAINELIQSRRGKREEIEAIAAK